MLKAKIKQGVLIAENLKKRIRGSTPTITNSGLTPTTSISLLPSPTGTTHDDRNLNNYLNNQILLFFCYS
jgi:hypothetical protein